MAGMFLESSRPLHTCAAESCDDCPVAEDLVCHFNMRHLSVFMLMAAPVFLLAGYIMYRFSPLSLLPWMLFIVAFFGFVEIRVMCSHCPHYAEPALKSLKCWANYGAPKFWKYRPEPMRGLEIAVFHAGFVLILGPPIVLAVVQGSYLLLGMYVVLAGVWIWALQRLYCTHCINFACPFNSVDSDVRRAFFVRNPAVAAAWEHTSGPELG